MSRININSRKKRSRSSRKSRGNYASFSLCIAAAVITISAAVVRAQKDKASLASEPSKNVTSSYQTPDNEKDKSNVDSSDTVKDNNSSDTTRQTSKANTSAAEGDGKDAAARVDEYEDFEDSEQTLAIQVIGKNLTYVRPIGGAVAKDYSMNGLVYSRTMGDWRVHNGVDISANEGETVKSAAEGTVAGISYDPLYGTTVVVNQNDGLMVYYRGLTKDTAVREGENISAGATIGTVGSVPCESEDGIHLHIEVMSDGKYLNPAEKLNIK